ncbi:hypothetical protein, partial [Phascolarctobacterium succinatutens]|uniref:hypothetical protein n=1 Tax=Phascolarctobacterium succinatutens TaxID=626940 RepID=UPI0030777233
MTFNYCANIIAKFCINIFNSRISIFQHVMQPIGADVFSSTCRNTDSLQKKDELASHGSG